MKSRYIKEDLPQGLVPMVKVAPKFGVETPAMDSIIKFGSVINQVDYMKEGISLGRFRRSKPEQGKILDVLNNGL